LISARRAQTAEEVFADQFISGIQGLSALSAAVWAMKIKLITGSRNG
jgi:hypothetical protein